MIIKNYNAMPFIIGGFLAVLGFLTIFEPAIFNEQLPWWFGIISVISVISGGFLLFSLKITTIRISKSSDELSLLRKGLSGRKIKKCKLHEIKSVKLISRHRYSDNGDRYSYKLALMLKNNKIVPLTLSSSTVVIMRIQIVPEKKIGLRIANFLNVPFEEQKIPFKINNILAAIFPFRQNNSRNGKI